ncbi:MAG: hypothetical protein ACOYL6_07490 [Bacteriovoracaceae bacterium]
MKNIKKFMSLAALMIAFTACSSAKKEPNDNTTKQTHQQNLLERQGDKGTGPAER